MKQKTKQKWNNGKMLRLENSANQLRDAIKKKTRHYWDPAAKLYREASCSASVSPNLCRSYWQVGRVSADTSMSCRYSSLAISKKDSGGAVFFFHFTLTHSLPRAQLPYWRQEGCSWQLRGRGNKNLFSLWGGRVWQSREKKGLPDVCFFL